MGTVLLGMSETDFWRCQPRRLFALWEVHKRMNGLDKADGNATAEEVFIDEIGW